MVILTLNCGSSSAKYQVYDWDNKDVLSVGVVERIGLEYSTIEHKCTGKDTYEARFSSPTHKEAIELILKMLIDKDYGCIKSLDEIGAVGHRVLHGGEMFKKSTLVDDDVVEKLKQIIPLGPLHMPANIMGIEAARKLMPSVPHAIIMDTAWHQTMPEESYMRNQSGIRKAVLSCIERFALKHSVLNIVVSKAMIKHYKRVYEIELNNAYVMPCYNVEFQRKCITEKNPESRAFVYAGGLSKWQCIEQMLQLYKQIEDSVEGKAKLLFLTPEIESAKELVKKYKILNCEVSCVHYSKLAEKMKQAKFGFALREDTVVNQVSTPTKLANYVASGIIPIYSECVRDFYEESKKNPYQVAIHDVNKISNSEIEKIIGLLEKTIESEELQKSMHTYFEQYYNTEWHIQHLSEMLGNAI